MGAGFIDNTYVGSLKGRYNCFWNEETARLDRFEDCEFIDEQLLKNIKDVISFGHTHYDKSSIVPTVTQRYALKPAFAGQEIHCLAKTGSGKTLCFGIPIASSLRNLNVTKVESVSEEVRNIGEQLRSMRIGHKKALTTKIEPDVIILAPTRE